MADHPSPHAVVTHQPPSPTRSNLPMLYYGLVVLGTAAIILILYNFIIIKWCTDLTDRQSNQTGSNAVQGTASGWRFRELNVINFVSSFKYKRDVSDDSECAVCLSVFEEGEELRQLPKCQHYFHAPCIDMWLYSHMDCPLCRSLVEPPGPHRSSVPEQSEHSREELLGRSTLV